jgi:hypothetical protein
MTSLSKREDILGIVLFVVMMAFAVTAGLVVNHYNPEPPHMTFD